MVYIMLADGFEEIEALVPADILRRAGAAVTLVGVTGAVVTGSHGITVQADKALPVAVEPEDMIMLPGGMPGTARLEESPELLDTIRHAANIGAYLSAICAAPSILGHMGLLRGKAATCFPGWERHLTGARPAQEAVVQDGRIITGKAAGAALEFGFRLAGIMTSPEKSDEVRMNMQCR